MPSCKYDCRNELVMSEDSEIEYSGRISSRFSDPRSHILDSSVLLETAFRVGISLLENWSLKVSTTTLLCRLSQTSIMFFWSLCP